MQIFKDYYHASAHWRAIAIAILSLRLSVCQLRSSILWKRLNILAVSSPPNHSSFINIKQLRKIPTGYTPFGEAS